MSSIKGLDKFLGRIKAITKEVESDIKDVVSINIGDMEAMAIRLAPGPGDRIKTETGSISQDQISLKRRGSGAYISQAIGSEIFNGGLGGRVYVEKSAGDIAGYTEFGTGQSAKVYLADKSPEWRAYAMLFYINGKGTIVNQPYLLPSFMKYSIQAEKEMKEIIRNIKL